jgi:hypothetical protein
MYRELETRVSHEGDWIALVWDDERDEVELHVETRHGLMHRIGVARERALDAISHPYVYLGLRPAALSAAE